MKNLSPSGVELEILMLGTFEFGGGDSPSECVAKFLGVLLETIHKKKDADYTQALLNCTLKTHSDMILDDKELLEKAETVAKASE